MWMKILIPLICRWHSGGFVITLIRKEIPFDLKEIRTANYLPAWGWTEQRKLNHWMIFTVTGPISLLQMKKPLKRWIKNGRNLVWVNLSHLHLFLSATSFMEKKPLLQFSFFSKFSTGFDLHFLT